MISIGEPIEIRMSRIKGGKKRVIIYFEQMTIVSVSCDGRRKKRLSGNLLSLKNFSKGV